MFYEINVAKDTKSNYRNEVNYRHFFATAPRSITTDDELKTALEIFMVAFPEPMYNITVTRDDQRSEGVNIEDFLNKKR